jgi:putative transposase
MKKSRFTETEIIRALKEHENGRSAADISRELGINPNTFSNWRKKYGGMDVQQLRRLKELEEENARLKKMYANISLDHSILKEVMEKNFPGSVKDVR